MLFNAKYATMLSNSYECGWGKGGNLSAESVGLIKTSKNDINHTLQFMI